MQCRTCMSSFMCVYTCTTESICVCLHCVPITVYISSPSLASHTLQSQEKEGSGDYTCIQLHVVVPLECKKHHE